MTDEAVSQTQETNEEEIPFKEALARLIKLQLKDKEVDQIKGQLNAVPAEIEAKHETLEEAKKEADSIKELGNRLLLDRKQLEGEAAKKDEEMKKFGGDLTGVKSNDAYNAILKQIDTLKAAKSAIEDKILENMDKADDLKKNEGRLKQEAEAKKKGVEAEVAVLEQKKKGIEENLAKTQSEREALTHGIPPAILSRYEKLRARKEGVALVPLSGMSCGGCRMSFTQGILNELKKGHDFVTCEKCLRILYIPTEDPAPKAA